MKPAVAVGLTFGNGYILNCIILYAKLESCGVRCAALCLAKTFECECVTGCVRVEDVEKKKRGMSKEVSEKPIFLTALFNFFSISPLRLEKLIIPFVQFP